MAKIKVGDEFVEPNAGGRGEDRRASPKESDDRASTSSPTTSTAHDGRRAPTRSCSSPTRSACTKYDKADDGRAGEGLPGLHHQRGGPAAAAENAGSAPIPDAAPHQDRAGRRGDRRLTSSGSPRRRRSPCAPVSTDPRRVRRPTSGAPAVWPRPGVRRRRPDVLRRGGGRRASRSWSSLAGVAIFLLGRGVAGHHRHAVRAARRQDARRLHRAAGLRHRAGGGHRDRHRGAARRRGRAVHHATTPRGGSRSSLGYVIDLLAAIPSVIYGLWGIAVLGPAAVGMQEWLADNLGFIPLFEGPGLGHGPHHAGRRRASWR